MELLGVRHRRLRALGAVTSAVIAGAIGVAGCFIGDEGRPPPLDSFYYPTGLVVSPGGKALYVANSDFDLAYNGGTVQVLDLEPLRAWALTRQAALAQAALADQGDSAATRIACEALPQGVKLDPLLGLGVNPNPLLHPGPCAPLEAAGFVRKTAIIGAFASGAILVHKADGPGARLFVPVRGDPSVTYFDVTDDRPELGGYSPCAGGEGVLCLECGASASDPRCTADHRIGDSPYQNSRGLKLLLEPVGIAADAAGEAIVVAHQTSKAATLLVNSWTAHPTLEHAITGLADGPTEVAPVPAPALVAASGGGFCDGVSHIEPIAYHPAFLLTFRAAPEINLLSYQDDRCAAPPRPFLTQSAVSGITGNSNGGDSRGVAVDASQRQACEQRCASGDLSCLATCATDVPIRMFVANRAPASLLIGEVRTRIVERDGERKAAFDTLSFHDTVPLSYGASRVAIGHVIDRDGKRALRVFAVAFDSRFIFSYDPEARRVDAIIRTGRGPHAVAFDTGSHLPSSPGAVVEPYAFMYVGHFTDSYIGVVDLDMRYPDTFGSMIITLGTPLPPQESR